MRWDHLVDVPAYDSRFAASRSLKPRYFVSDDFTDMPPDATAYQVAYNEALNEYEININLVIELHGYL